MIHIDLNRIPINERKPLADAAAAAQDEINREVDPAKRRDLVEAHRKKWVAFRALFEKYFHQKCWYTESRNPGTDEDVDHFRPKGRIAEDHTHGGYYWIALTWTNFRLSCHRANRLRENPASGDTHGKGDHFPLFDPARRARVPADSLDEERPLLLDPCDAFDPPKLTFKTDGTVAVSPQYEDQPEAVAQVEQSRRYLHLDWPAFVDDRVKLYNQIFVKIEQGRDHDRRFTLNGDLGSRKALRDIAIELAALMREEQPYSAAAKAYISVFRNLWWVSHCILRDIGSSKGAA